MPSKTLPYLFFDTVVLSNFAFANGLKFLKKRYEGRGVVTLQVMQEIVKASFADWRYTEQIEKSLFTDGFHKTSLTENEQDYYISLLRNLGEGEASCIAAAFERSGIVVTDDRAARNFCKERNIGVTGTIGILKASCLDGTLEEDIADKMLSEMISHGFYSPIQKIRDIL